MGSGILETSFDCMEDIQDRVAKDKNDFSCQFSPSDMTSDVIDVDDVLEDYKDEELNVDKCDRKTVDMSVGPIFDDLKVIETLEENIR